MGLVYPKALDGWHSLSCLRNIKEITDTHGIPFSSEFDQDLAVGVRQLHLQVGRLSLALESSV
jgi:hypothetical protein